MSKSSLDWKGLRETAYLPEFAADCTAGRLGLDDRARPRSEDVAYGLALAALPWDIEPMEGKCFDTAPGWSLPSLGILLAEVVVLSRSLPAEPFQAHRLQLVVGRIEIVVEPDFRMLDSAAGLDRHTVVLFRSTVNDRVDEEVHNAALLGVVNGRAFVLS